MKWCALLCMCVLLPMAAAAQNLFSPKTATISEQHRGATYTFTGLIDSQEEGGRALALTTVGCPIVSIGFEQDITGSGGTTGAATVISVASPNPTAAQITAGTTIATLSLDDTGDPFAVLPGYLYVDVTGDPTATSRINFRCEDGDIGTATTLADGCIEAVGGQLTSTGSNCGSAMGGVGDITSVAGVASGGALEDGVVSGGSTTILSWEGSVADAGEINLISPVVNPASDINLTVPAATGTLIASASLTSEQYRFGPIYVPQPSDGGPPGGILFSPLALGFASTVTVAEINCVAVGGGTIGLRLRECTTAALSSCVTTETTITCDADGTAVTSSIDDGTWDDGDWIAFELDEAVGTVDQLTFSVMLLEAVVK